MSSLDIAASASLRRDETVLIALLLAFVGDGIDACTWREVRRSEGPS